MVSNNKSFGFPILWIIVVISAISLMISLFSSVVFFNSLDGSNLKVDALIIPNTNKTETMPINNNTYRLNKDEFIEKFLTEYIVTRYTIVPSTYIMNNNLELNNLTSNINYNSGILKQASVVGTSLEGSTIWSDAYFNFINGKDGELQAIQELMKQNISRSVRIISKPKKENDWWVAKVEFIYKNPSTYSVSAARKEVYEIRMDISSSENIRPTTFAFQYPNASSIFVIVVNYLKKTRL